MGHGLTATDTMYSVNKMPWHHLGTVTENAPANWAEARKLSGIDDWDTITAPSLRQVFVRDENGRVLYGPNGEAIGESVRDYQGHVILGPDGEPIPMVEREPGHQRHMRSDNGMTLHIAQNSWTAITHVDMGQIMDVVLPMDDVRFETGGSLEEGRKVWSLLRIGNGRTVTGDRDKLGRSVRTLPYVVLLTAHDGTSSFKLIPTAVRVVCANTWHYAETAAEKQGLGFSLRHTQNWRTQVEEMKKALGYARAEFERTMDIAEKFAAIEVSPTDEDAFWQWMVPMDVVRHTDKQQENILKAREQMRTILYSETTASVAHTGYGLIQAVGEWTDHIQTAMSVESRFGRAMLRPNDYKQRAVKGVRKLERGELELTA